MWKSAARRAGFGWNMAERRGDRLQEREGERAAEHARRRDCRPARAGSPGPLAAFEQRIDRAAEIRAEHEGQVPTGLMKLRVSERHRQHDDGDLECAAQARTAPISKSIHGACRRRRRAGARLRRIFGRRQRVQEHVERQEHQARGRSRPGRDRAMRVVGRDDERRRRRRRAGRRERMATSKDRSWTTSVVPTLAPSITRQRRPERDEARRV